MQTALLKTILKFLIILGIWQNFAWITFWTISYTANETNHSNVISECNRSKLKGWKGFLYWASRQQHSFPQGVGTRKLARFPFRVMYCHAVTHWCAAGNHHLSNSPTVSRKETPDLTTGAYCPATSSWLPCPALEHTHSSTGEYFSTLFTHKHLYVHLNLSQTLNVLPQAGCISISKTLSFP